MGSLRVSTGIGYPHGMARIRFTKQLATTANGDCAKGDLVDVDQQTAERYVRAGYATLVTPANTPAKRSAKPKR